MEQSGNDLIGKVVTQFNDRVMLSKKGEVCGVFTFMTDGTKGMLDEQYLHERYLKSFAHREIMPDDLKIRATLDIEESNRGRAHIQAYKIKHNIPLDTPLCFHESVRDDLQGDIAEPVMER